MFIDGILLFLIKIKLNTAAGGRRIAAIILPLSPSGKKRASRRTKRVDAEKIRIIFLSVIIVLLSRKFHFNNLDNNQLEAALSAVATSSTKKEPLTPSVGSFNNSTVKV